MNRIRNIVAIFVAILALAQSSCVESEEPLTDPAKCKVDEQLLGKWQTTKSGTEPIQVQWRLPRPKEIANSPAGLMLFSVVGDDKDHTRSPVFATSVGKDKYLQLIVMVNGTDDADDWDKRLVRSHRFSKYTIVEDKLTVCVMDIELTAKAVKAKELAGVEGFRLILGQEVRLSGSTDHLVKYLENGGNKTHFPDSKKIVFERVKK